MLTLWDPERGAALVPELEGAFEPLARPFLANLDMWTRPRLAEVEETPEELIVTVDLPGHDPAKLELTAELETLTIRSERARKELVERYVEEIPVPGTDVEKAEAKLEDGVLTVKLPKRAEVKPRKIAVH